MEDYLNNVEEYETQENLEPEIVEGEEEQEHPEPADKTDAGFARLRREGQEKDSRIRELELELARKDKALGMYFEGDNKEIKAIAHAMGVSEEEVTKQMNAETELQALRNENLELRISQRQESDLKELQAIDPDIKSLDDMDDYFFKCISNGMTAKESYFASKGMAEATKITPPKQVGKVSAAPPVKDFFTREEVQNMSQAELKENHSKIMASMPKW